MSITLSLGPNNDLEAISPSGRRVYIPIGPHSTQLLWQLLWNSTGERRKGFVGDFPTQAVMNSWATVLSEAKREASAAFASEQFEKKFGFSLDELEIEL